MVAGLFLSSKAGPCVWTFRICHREKKSLKFQKNIHNDYKILDNYTMKTKSFNSKNDLANAQSVADCMEHESFKAYKTDCFNFARKMFQGKTFKNKNKKVNILVSRTGLNEWFSKTKTYEQSESIRFLDKILEDAIYNHSAKNEHPKQGDENSSFDYFDYSLIMNDKKYDVILTVKNVAGQGSIYYHHFLYDIKIKPSSSVIQP